MHKLKFRFVFAALALVLAALTLPRLSLAGDEVTVYKSATCGCCTGWVDHMKAAGFSLKVENRDDLNAIKQAHGVTRELASCHTALVGGYVIEGHVPAADIQRLLRERPAVKGLAVPGMPMGSPGMEGPTKQPYNVVSFDDHGRIMVFSRH